MPLDHIVWQYGNLFKNGRFQGTKLLIKGHATLDMPIVGAFSVERGKRVEF